MWLLVVGLGAAQAADVAAEEVVVWGRDPVELARKELVDTLIGAGYRRVRREDGKIVLLHEQAWKGKVVLHDDGWMEVRRQGVRLETPDTWLGEHAPPLAWLPCVTQPSRCVRLGGVVLSTRKMSQVKDRVVGTADPGLDRLGDALADAAVTETLTALPERLRRCWEAGDPLVSAGPLASPASRRAELLAYWATRTDNPWGRRVKDAVEAFVRAEVQTSGDPFPEAELVVFDE